MKSIIDGNVPQSQAGQANSNFQQSKPPYKELVSHLYGLDAINSLLIEYTAQINEESGVKVTIEQYRDYSGMSTPALQARIRKLREELPEGSNTCFLAYEKDGLKYLHSSLIPYTLIKEINEKRGISFEKYLSKYANKSNKSENTLENPEEITQDSQESVSFSRDAEKFPESFGTSNTSTEKNNCLEFNDSEELSDENHLQESHEREDLSEEFPISSNPLESGKIVAVIFSQIVHLKKEVLQLRQENQYLKDTLLEQQNNLANLEQQLKEGTNKKIADALDQLLTFNQYTQ